jgi:hypothetical protein
MHKLSVGVFSQFLGSLPELLDRAAVDAVKKDFLGTPDRASQV